MEHGHSSNQNQPKLQPELGGRSVHPSPASPALMFSSCQEGTGQARSRAAGHTSPFPQPFLAVVFSPRGFFPNPSLRGALKTDVREGTADIWLGDTFWSEFTSRLYQSPLCLPTDHLIIQCFTLLSANMFKHLLFLDFFFSFSLEFAHFGCISLFGTTPRPMILCLG